MIYKRHLHTQIYYDLIAFLDVVNSWTTEQTFQENTMFEKYIKMKNQQRLYLSDTKATYMTSNATGTQMIYYFDNTKVFEGSSSGIFFKKNLAVQSPGYLLMQVLAGTPSASGGYGKVFCLDVGGDTEVFCKDDANNDTQLSAHDKDGYYVHRSKIPKRKLKLQIDIEKFFRKHYPEYVNSKELDLEPKDKRIRYTYLLKKNLLRLTIVSLVALEVTRLINPWG